jgi:hypothetical protein
VESEALHREHHTELVQPVTILNSSSLYLLQSAFSVMLTCHGSKFHSLLSCLLLGRLMGSLALHMRPLLPLLPSASPPAGEPLRHLLPIAPLLLPSSSASCCALSSSAITSSNVSMAASGLALLLAVLVLLRWPPEELPLLLLVLEVGSTDHDLPAVSWKSSRVRMNQGGSLDVDLLSERQAVSFRSRTARLTSSCLRCCCGRFGGKLCTMLRLLGCAGLGGLLLMV